MNAPMEPQRPSLGRTPDTAADAVSFAQWIAFAPTVFQAARSLRDTGILAAVDAARKEGLTLAEICAKTALSTYGARVLVEAALGIGLMRELDGEPRRYVPTPTARVLLHDRMTRANMDFSHDVTYHGMFALDAAAKSGKPEGLKHFGDWPTVYEALAHLPEPVRKSWFAFDHYYSDAAFDAALKAVFCEAPCADRQGGPSVPLSAGDDSSFSMTPAQPPKRLLDIGGNTGKWALRCLRHDAQVHVGLFDLPGQLSMARATLAQAGLAARATFHEGNLLDEGTALPGGYDTIWMSQFLDCFGEDEIVSILRRCRAALAPGGRIQIMELFWDRQRFPAASFSLQMTSLYFTAVANGSSQMYRAETFLDCVRAAGLEIERSQDQVGLYHTLLTCRVP